MSSNNNRITGYDIIGDVHGCADTLKTLLNKLGYERQGHGYAYADNKRQLIFVGDLIDRGPQIKETLQLVKASVDAGQAQLILGNHEFNAIAYFTRVKNGFLRPRNARSKAQFQGTLDQFKHEETTLMGYIDWFKSLPLFLDLPEFRVVHACWDQTLIETYYQRFGSNQLTNEALEACVDGDSSVTRAINRLTCGLNIKYPAGVNSKGQDGFVRDSFRAKFWTNDQVKTYQDIVFQPDPLPEFLSDRLVSTADHEKLFYYSSSDKPLFIGHYWLKGKPGLVAKNIACLDYSAVLGGQLVAYQFNLGDKQLDANHFVGVDYKDSS